MKNNLWKKIVAGAAIIAIAGGAAAVIKNGSRITALETHIPYIKAALDRIEKKMGEMP